MKKAFAILALTGAITACGGGSSSSNDNDKTPPSTDKIGVLTDGIVSGVSYVTNRGTTGTTNDKGEFTYQDGDKVKFSIGSVQLGDEIVAQARVTPLDLAQDENSRTNLLVFLQSFDSDSDHDNGISISDQAITALTEATIDFSQSPESFIDDLPFRKAMAKADLTDPVTPEQAKENFRKAFYKEIAGVWSFSENTNAQTPNVVIYITDNGEFYLGEFSQIDDAGKPGIEIGQLNWNSINKKLAPTINIDTNGEWGLSHPQGHYTLDFDGTNLILKEPEINRTNTFTRVADKTNSIIGSWIYTAGESQVFSFFENGYYMMLDPVGDTMVEEGDTPCGGAGVELGKYTINNSNLNIHSVTIDTNDCAGLSDEKGNQTLPFQTTGDKFTFSPENEGSFTLDRIK